MDTSSIVRSFKNINLKEILKSNYVSVLDTLNIVQSFKIKKFKSNFKKVSCISVLDSLRIV